VMSMIGSDAVHADMSQAGNGERVMAPASPLHELQSGRQHTRVAAQRRG
jgi:hypothetical protein